MAQSTNKLTTTEVFFSFIIFERLVWYRTLLLLMIPLISLTGLWQFPVFFGARQPHVCVDGKPVMLPVNDTTCAMENTYLTEFGLYCDKADIGPWLQSAANLGGMVGHMLWGLCQLRFARDLINFIIFRALVKFIILKKIFTNPIARTRLEGGRPTLLLAS